MTLDRSLLTEEVRLGIEDADRLTARDLLAAEDACHRLNLQLTRVFETCDLLLTPTLHRTRRASARRCPGSGPPGCST